MAVDKQRQDPLTSFHFAVEVQGVITGYFMECSGLGSETDTIEHNVVTAEGVEVVLKVPGRLKWEDIVLKRGITSNLDMWQWRAMVEKGDVENARRDGSIIMFDQTLKEVARWNFENAWPKKVSGPQVKSDGNELGVEEMTITHEYIVRVS